MTIVEMIEEPITLEEKTEYNGRLPPSEIRHFVTSDRITTKLSGLIAEKTSTGRKPVRLVMGVTQYRMFRGWFKIYDLSPIRETVRDGTVGKIWGLAIQVRRGASEPFVETETPEGSAYPLKEERRG